MLKKGLASSEFWIIVGVILFALMSVSGYLTGDKIDEATERITGTAEALPALIDALKGLVEKFGGLLVLAGLAWAYLKRRSTLKEKEMNAGVAHAKINKQGGFVTMSRSMIAILLTVLLLFIAPLMVFAQASETLKFGWNQDGLEYVSGWELKWASSADGPWEPVLDTGGQPVFIQYSPDTMEGPEYFAEKPFVVEGEPGSTITKYFTLVAVGKGDTPEKSGIAEPVSHGFFVPYQKPGEPYGLTIEVIVQPQ